MLNINKPIAVIGLSTIRLNILFIRISVLALISIMIVPALNSCRENDGIIINAGNVESINIPKGDGSPVLLDGIFSDGEWDDALVLGVPDSIKLLFKKYKGFVFIGIKCPKFIGPSVDLYLNTGDSKIHQFHISAQLAELVISNDTNNTAEPSIKWGFTKDWYANEIRWDEQELQRIMESKEKSRIEAFGKTVYPSEGIEMQIRQSKLPASQWLLRMEILYSPDYTQPFIYPERTTNSTFENWLKLVIKD